LRSATEIELLDNISLFLYILSCLKNCRSGFEKMAIIYLDTSIPSAYYNRKHRERMEITRGVWHEVLPKHELVISNITARELSATTNKKDRRKLLEMVKSIKMAMANADCFALSEEYLKIISVPLNDALHVAIATIFKCDILLSWNFAHLVNFQNRAKINGVNLIYGHKQINIISPYELGG